MGTPAYMAPELFSEEKCHRPNDIWSLGICLFELLTFKRPYDRSYGKGNYKNIKQLLPNYVSSFFKELIAGMLVVDYTKRLTIDPIVAKLVFYWNSS